VIEPAHARHLSIGELSSPNSFILGIEGGARRFDEIGSNALAAQFLRQRAATQTTTRMACGHPRVSERRIIDQTDLFESIEDGIGCRIGDASLRQGLRQLRSRAGR